MRLARVIIRVTDLPASIRFWSEDVGLGLLWSTGEFAFLDAGPSQLMLNVANDASTEALTELVFEVDDVRASFEEMRARGVPFEVELRPVTADENGRELLAAHFTDPDGNLASVTGWVTQD